MADPFFDASPRTFPGDPNPPSSTPEAPKTSTGTATAPPTSAGTGALPPERQPQPNDGPQPQGPKADRYSVVEGPDGVRRGFAWDKDSPTPTGPITAPDADKVLAAVGNYNPATKTWDNVPPEIFKTLTTGRLPLPDYLAAKFGEGNSLRGIIGNKFLSGEMSDDEAKERGQADLLKMQLKEAPILAWQGSLGDTVAKMWQDFKAAGIGGTARRAAGEVAAAAPDLLRMGGDAAKDAGILGAGGFVMGGPPGAIALGGVGLTYGIFKHISDVSAGNKALDMLDQGFEPETVKKVAPLVGAINGALGALQVNVMTKSMQEAAIGKLLESPTITGAIARYVSTTTKGISLNAAQSLVNDTLTDVAAQMENKPELSVQHPIANMVNSAITSAPVMAGLALPGAVLEGLRGQQMTAPKMGDLEGAAAASQERPAGASPAPGPETAASPSYGVLGEPSTGARQTPPESSEAGSPRSSEQEERAPSNVSLADKAKFDKVLKYRTMAGEKTPEETVTRMKGEAEAMRSLISGENSPIGEKGSEPTNVKFIQSALARHEADIATLEKGGRVHDSTTNKYVTDRPYDASALESGRTLRETFVGQRNENIARINQFAQSMKRAIPDKDTQLAMRWYAEARGDNAVLQDWLDQAKAPAEPGVRPSTLANHAGEIKAAMNLPQAAKDWIDKGNEYFQEAGAVAKKNGVLRALRENYQLNHVYLPEKADENLRTEMTGGLRRSTGHALERTYDTLADAALEGKRIAPIGYADLISQHGAEMAKAVESRKMLDFMDENKVGGWKQDRPEGWQQVGQLEKSVPIKDKQGNPVLGEDGNQLVQRSKFYAPQGIAKSLEAITQPNFVSWIDSLRGLQRYQGLVKTVDLSYSLFHHMSLLAAAVNEGDLKSIAGLPKVWENMETPEFKAQEQAAALHGVVTGAVSPNLDVTRELAKDEGGVLDKVTQLPGVKQAAEQTDRNARLLFDGWARYMKVNDFTRIAANIAADNPTLTDKQLTPLLRDAARHVNATFGGVNWESMGVTKSAQAVGRLVALAPDWLTSNAQFIKQALAERGVAGQLSRAHLARAIGSSLLATEGLSLLSTGHSSFSNPKGHKYEWEAAPHVYVSFLRGGPGELAKIASMIAESGPEAPGRYAQAKASPLARTAAEALSRVKYNGQPIVPEKHKGTLMAFYDVVKELFSSAGPIPFALSGLNDYRKSGEATPLGTLLVAAGIGRYSPPPKGGE